MCSDAFGCVRNTLEILKNVGLKHQLFVILVKILMGWRKLTSKSTSASNFAPDTHQLGVRVGGLVDAWVDAWVDACVGVRGCVGVWVWRGWVGGILTQSIARLFCPSGD